jgi:hypothetical protein
MSIPLRITREAFEERLLAQTRAWLNEDEAFLAATTPRERCAHARRVLRLEHTPESPFALIGQLLDIDRGTVSRQITSTQSSKGFTVPQPLLI